MGETDTSGLPRIVSVEKIWDEGRHNAFTDLVLHRDVWYCTFREGEKHARGADGQIRVIRSRDGTRWESAGLIVEDGVDLRDPKLSVMPDGRLMLLAGGSVFDDDTYLTRAPRVAFSGDGIAWTDPQKVLAEDHWLWRATWHEGRAYCVSKMGEGRKPRRGMLYSTADGLTWEYITEFEDPEHRPSETTLRFMPDGQMVALVRRNKTGWIGKSDPPYRKWAWVDIGHQLGGPEFIRLPDGSLWASGRSYGEEPRTVLARMTKSSYTPVLTFPSGGDNSYPGMVWHEGLIWMSYYSSHEEKTSIYLAKIQIR